MEPARQRCAQPRRPLLYSRRLGVAAAILLATILSLSAREVAADPNSLTLDGPTHPQRLEAEGAVPSREVAEGLLQDTLMVPRLAVDVATRWPSSERLRAAGYPLGSPVDAVRVMLSILVDREGGIEKIDVYESNDPGRVYNAAALDAARSATFHPGSSNGDPQRMWTLLSIDFPPGPLYPTAAGGAAPPWAETASRRHGDGLSGTDGGKLRLAEGEPQRTDGGNSESRLSILARQSAF